MNDTKTRILDSAERLFSDSGFASTSLRAIIAEAGVNLAAVHYHFKSKDSLLEAIIERRAGPVNAERLERLNTALRTAHGRALPLKTILEAFLVPALPAVKRNRNFPKLLGRIYAEGSDSIHRIFEKHFGDVVRMFLHALAEATPHLQPEERNQRLVFSVGAVSNTLMSVRQSADLELVLRRLIAFLAAGFAAPATQPKVEP
jgi:AcrR family transcriptional regulator